MVHEQSGELPDLLNIPPIPTELIYLWNYFQCLNRKRTVGMNAPNPLSDSEILAWQRRNRVVLDPFENDCIDALDQAFLDASSKK